LLVQKEKREEIRSFAHINTHRHTNSLLVKVGMSRNFPSDDYDIDMEKLSKLEKMIIRVDNDIQKMQLDNDKVQVTMTLKKVFYKK